MHNRLVTKKVCNKKGGISDCLCKSCNYTKAQTDFILEPSTEATENNDVKFKNQQVRFTFSDAKTKSDRKKVSGYAKYSFTYSK